MILLLGNTYDDVLYYDKSLQNRHEEVILKRYKLIFGTIFNQNVCIFDDAHTGYLTSAIVTYIVEKYNVLMIFLLSKVTAYSSNLNIGDIVISKKTVLGDVDQIGKTHSMLGQITPNYPSVYYASRDMIDTVVRAFEKRTYSKFYYSTYVTMNKVVHYEDQLDDVVSNETLIGEDENIVLDSECGSIALISTIFDVPFVAVGVVEKVLESNANTIDNYVKVLDIYSFVGKAIVSSIGEIGRNDILFD